MTPDNAPYGNPPLVIVDGAGDRYRVADYAVTLTLVRESDGLHVRNVGLEQLRSLGVEWDGRTLKQVGDDAR